MKILTLTIKKKWFDMILSGEKTEEYRELKHYWIRRFDNFDYDAIKFTNGYGNYCPSFIIECNGVAVGYGEKEWGAPPDKPVYILSLGSVLAENNALLEEDV